MFCFYLGVVTSSSMSMLRFFTHLTPQFIAYNAFIGGFLTASVVGAGALTLRNGFTIRADPVFQRTLAKVSTHRLVTARLGGGITAGNLRSYRLDSGRFETVNNSIIWRPARIQMLFNIQGKLFTK